MKSIEDLEVYKKVHLLTLDIYRLTEKFPKDELFGLVSQMRRAAVSINSNLSEGGARLSRAELLRFIGISRGSASELKYQLLLSQDLGFVKKEEYKRMDDNLTEILKMLTGLVKNINNEPVTNH